MSESCTWDGSWSALKWVRETIPGAVAQFSEQDWTLALRTDRGERYVPYGWVITRDDGGAVSIAPGESVNA